MIEVHDNSKRPQPLNEVKGDKKYGYRWVSKADKAFSLRKGQGWTPATKEEAEAKFALGSTVDGTTQHGDLILCKIPKEKLEQKRRAKEAMVKAQLDAIKDKADELKIERGR